MGKNRLKDEGKWGWGGRRGGHGGRLGERRCCLQSKMRPKWEDGENGKRGA